MKKLLFLMIAAVAVNTAMAKDYRVLSPDGRTTVTVSTTPALAWSLSRDGEALLNSGRIGLQFTDEAPAGTPAVRRAVSRFVDTGSEMPMPTKFRALHDRCNELFMDFRGGVALRMRVYDNGVAYRFELSRKGTVKIANETSEFRFAEDCSTLWPRENNPDFISHCEAFFDRRHVSEIGADFDGHAYLPVYFATPKGTRMVITESDLEEYPCLHLFGDEGTALHAEFPPVVLKSRLREGSDRNEEFLEKAPYIAEVKGQRTLPWRIVTVDPDDRALLENYLPAQLASPAIDEDYSWVKPGKIAWEWWHSLNLYGVDFRAGVNTQTYKYYIDFAARYGLDYILLDEGWSVSTLNIRECRPEVDVEELARYGREKGVGVVLWTLWNPLKKDLEGILDTYQKWGVRGIKVDFMQRCDQEMVRFYEQIARAAFDRHLVVDFHGSFKPAGLQRKFPNVLSYEGVYGMEHDKCSTDISPVHDCTLPFTRMVAGPMDYTPGATRNAQKRDFTISWDRPVSQGTRAHQAALYVVFESPLQMLCDSPSDYMRNPEFTEFIAAVPTVWDETVALHASCGEYVAIARRNGDKWYIGAITDWSPRSLEVSLDFLGEGTYTMKSFEDGINADRCAEDARVSERTVNRQDKITLNMAPGGGWAAVISAR